MDGAAGLLQSPVENLAIWVLAGCRGFALTTLQGRLRVRCPFGPAAAAAVTAFQQVECRCAVCVRWRFTPTSPLISVATTGPRGPLNCRIGRIMTTPV